MIHQKKRKQLDVRKGVILLQKYKDSSIKYTSTSFFSVNKQVWCWIWWTGQPCISWCDEPSNLQSCTMCKSKLTLATA